MSCLDYLDINALPLKTPLLLMTAEGNLLKDASTCMTVPFVELQQAREGAIEIRRSGSARVFFGRSFSDKHASKVFETFSTRSGMVVFKICQGNAYLEGWSEGVTYNSSYEGKQQQWQLLKSVLPPSLPLKDLAAASLSDLTARRQLTLHLSEAGNSSEVVAETLKLLYGTAQPKGDPNIDLSVAERHELVLLKLIKMNMPVETTRATMALLYEPDPRTKIESEQTTAAQDECSTECGEQFVTVEHVSADHADLDAIPVNSPLFMISSSGSTLNTSETGSAFVKLNESEDGLITIQSANDESKCLILNEYLQCVFGSADAALKFKMRLSKAGRLVLVDV